jgi:hypothetical protein
MELTKARDKYFETCGDKYAYQHFLNFRGNQLGPRVVAEWLLLRMRQDTKPFVNLNGSINNCVNSENDLKDFISDWCQSTN